MRSYIGERRRRAIGRGTASGTARKHRWRPVVEQLEDRLTPSLSFMTADPPDPPAAVYVNPAFTGERGSDPDGAGPATALGFDAFPDLQQAIDAVAAGGTVHVADGTYAGGLTLSKAVKLQGSGSASTFVDGAGTDLGVNITAPGAEVSGLTVRGFGTGLVASGGSYLALTDVGLTGNTFGGSVEGVTTFLFAGGAADEALFVRPGLLAREGDQPLNFGGVQNLTVDGGGGNNRLVVFLNDTDAADTVWLNGAAVARATAPFLLWYRATGSFGGGVVLVLGEGHETMVVQGQVAGAPTTVYGVGGDDIFCVALTPSSAYAGLTLDGGSGQSVLGIFDLSGGAAMQGVGTVIGVGKVLATYPDGSPSTIYYQNLGQLLNDLPGALPPTLGFAAPASFPTGGGSNLAVADVNRDGLLDLITAPVTVGGTGSSLSVLLNTTAPGAAPSFAPPQIFGAGGMPIALIVADINSDGLPDLVTATFQRTVSVLLNMTAAGAGTVSFAPPVNIPVHPFADAGPTSVTTADINGDGKPDLVVTLDPTQYLSILDGGTNSDGIQISPTPMRSPVLVLLNTTAAGAATASFAPLQTFSVGEPVKSFPTGHADFQTTVVDVNGDGKPDFIDGRSYVLPDGTSAQVMSVLLNTTAAGATVVAFAPAQTFDGGFSCVTAGDVNGDGNNDLVTGGGLPGVSVLLNTTAPGAGTVSFAPAKSYPTDRNVPLLAIADVNGDGRPDLIAQYGGAGASVYLNLMAPGATAPVFASPQIFTPFGNALIGPLAVADVSGDGKPDLLLGNGPQGTVSVLLNTTA